MVVAVIYVLGALHGLILALVLAQKKINRLPNKLLALIMVVFSIDLGMAAFQSFGLHELYPHFIGIDYPVTLLYGPLLYLYVKTMHDGNSQLHKFDYLHFIPFAFLLIYMIPFYLGPAADKLTLINNASLHNTYSFGTINNLKVLHGLTYVAGVIGMLVSYRKRLKNSFSTIEKINLNWLQHFIIATAILAGIAGALHFIPVDKKTVLIGLSDGIYDDITLLAVTVFVYGIGYMGLHQPEVFVRPLTMETKQNSKSKNGTFFSDVIHKKYQKSGLGDKQAEQYTRKLIRVMEQEKVYRNSELTLDDLARELDISSHNLTEVINRYIGKNFYDFVNTYRVENVKQQLRDPQSAEQTILAIGLDAGFNSKSTFNAVFKKRTGMTPSQFRKKHRNSD